MSKPVLSFPELDAGRRETAMTARIGAVLLVALVVVSVVSAASVEYRQGEVSLISQVLQLFGLEDTPTVNNSPVEVFVGETRLAVIPSDSPLVGKEVHDYCIENYQYGTDSFIVCEATI